MFMKYPPYYTNLCEDCKKPCTYKSKRCCKCNVKIQRNIIILRNKSRVGYKQSEEHKRKRLDQIKGKNHGNWAGDKIKYDGLHSWVKRNLLKAKLCQKCKKKPPYDLANKGTYNRELKNWEWLCRKCHMKKDGRLTKFIKMAKAGPRKRSSKRTGVFY